MCLENEHRYSLAAQEVSISPLGYEVDESAGTIQVTVQKSGIFPTPVTGTITASAGTAGRNLVYYTSSL